MPTPILELTDDVERVNVMYARSPEVMTPETKGLGQTRFVPHGYDEAAQTVEKQLFLENWNLVIQASDTDRLSNKISKFIRLLRRAWQYWNKKQFTAPVYLIERAACETESRHALVRRCPELNLPKPLANMAFDSANLLEGTGITIARYIWREGIPGTLPSLSTLTKTDGPVDDTQVHVCNFQDDHEMTHVFRYNDGVGYSANLYQSGVYLMFPSPPNAADAIYFGSPTPFWHFNALVAQAGNPTGLTIAWEYSDGVAGWPALTLGDDLTLYPDDEPWDTPAGDLLSFNFMPGSDWAVENVNGQTLFWVRARITAVTTWATMTSIDDDYNQRTPEIRLPSTLCDGDVSPYLMLRLRHPDGGDETPEMSTTSRILIGKKSRRLSAFTSRINLGNDGNPANWTVTAGTDASFVADPRSPGGDWCNVTFAGDSTMVLRATVTGTNRLANMLGAYRVFMRVFQVSGDADDMNVQLVVKINSAGLDAPAMPFPERQVKDGGVGEIIDMTPGGILQIPFADYYDADALSPGDIIFEIYAERAAGTGTIDFIDLIFIPADEWIVDLNDPISNAVTGNSALRGLTILDVDSGIIANRTVKQLLEDSNIYLAETWSRRSEPINIEPAIESRLYFLIGHYPSGGDWGDIPWIGSQGMHLAAELYKQNTFLYLRGDS